MVKSLNREILIILKTVIIQLCLALLEIPHRRTYVY